MKIQLKRSNVLEGGVAKRPTAEQMEYGELAVNYNANDPVIFLKDHLNQIIEININNIGSIDSGSTPPSTDNNTGDLYFDTGSNQLLFWNGTSWVPLNTNLGYTQAPTKGTITNSSGNDADIPLADGTYAGLLSPEQYTKLLNLVGVVLDSPSNGLKVTNDKLSANIATTSSLGTVKIGTGLDVKTDGTISVTNSGGGTVSEVNLDCIQNADNNIITNDTPGRDATIGLVSSSVAGLMGPDEYDALVDLSNQTFLTSINLTYQKNGNNDGVLTAADGKSTNIPVATDASAGLMTGVEKGQLRTLVNSGGGGGGGSTSVNLGYTSASDQGTVFCKAGGDSAVIPASSDKNAGLMLPADYNLLYALGSSALQVVNLSYSAKANGGDITCSAGDNATIPFASASNAGLMTAADYTQLYSGSSDDGRNVKINDNGTIQVMRSVGLAFSPNSADINDATILIDTANGGLSGYKVNGAESVTAGGVLIRSGGTSARNSTNISIGNTNGENLKEINGGSYNVAIGYDAMTLMHEGVGNIAIGERAMTQAGGYTNIETRQAPYHNIGIGYNALQRFRPDDSIPDALDLIRNNIAIGYQAGSETTTGWANTVVGYEALNRNTVGYQNTAFGYRALATNEKTSGNTAIGLLALENYVNEDADDGAGTNNVAVGKNSMRDAKNCIQNVALGNASLLKSQGDQNTAIGQGSLNNLTTGYKNTALGFSAGVGITNHINATCLGHDSTVSGSNQVQLGNSATTTYAYGAVQNRSDARDKTDIRDTLLGLDFIKSLRPVDFRWNYREDYYNDEEYTEDGEPSIRKVAVPQDGSRSRARFHHGLIAQEVKQAADSQNVDFAGYQDHSTDGGDDVLSLGYSELIAPLIKAVQQLSEENADLKARIETLENS